MLTVNGINSVKGENCTFSVWNYKYNRFLPCDIVKKIDNKFVKVIEYHETDGEISTVVPWCEIRNRD